MNTSPKHWPPVIQLAHDVRLVKSDGQLDHAENWNVPFPFMPYTPAGMELYQEMWSMITANGLRDEFPSLDMYVEDDPENGTMHIVKAYDAHGKLQQVHTIYISDNLLMAQGCAVTVAEHEARDNQPLDNMGRLLESTVDSRSESKRLISNESPVVQFAQTDKPELTHHKELHYIAVQTNRMVVTNRYPTEYAQESLEIIALEPAAPGEDIVTCIERYIQERSDAIKVDPDSKWNYADVWRLTENVWKIDCHITGANEAGERVLVMAATQREYEQYKLDQKGATRHA